MHGLLNPVLFPGKNNNNMIIFWTVIISHLYTYYILSCFTPAAPLHVLCPRL